MIDLTYSTNGLFTTFYPESKEGEQAYKEIIDKCGAPKIFTKQLPGTLAQLRKAGYKVRKAKKTNLSIDQILTELETL